MLAIEYDGVKPDTEAAAFIAPNATLIGQVVLQEGANVWFGAVLRGDENNIVIGPRVSVQDNAVIHVNHRHPTIVEADVTIGHGVIMEGCHIEQGALIGMNATILDGAVVGAGAIIAAGSVVREDQIIPAGMLAAGVPAKVKGPVSDLAKERAADAPKSYQRVSGKYRVQGVMEL